MTSRLYADAGYRATRRWWVSMVELGGVLCHLCGLVIEGDFDLDHVRGEGGLLHPAHPVCNRAEGGRQSHGDRLERGAGSLTGAARVPTRHSPSLPRDDQDPRL